MALNSLAIHASVSEPSAGTRRSRSPWEIRRAVVSKRCKRRMTDTRITRAMAPTMTKVKAPVPATIQRRSRVIAVRTSPAL